MEQEMGPAMKRVEQSLGSAMDVFADNLGSPNFPVTSHRRRVVSANRADQEDGEREPPTSGPGLHDFIFGGQSLDPFAIFGVSRRKWWEKLSRRGMRK